jgi:hypothetical protein
MNREIGFVHRPAADLAAFAGMRGSLARIAKGIEHVLRDMGK